ncbi:protein-tyrosine kinase [Bifidobacterium ramosum]|uniref:non-specific protein-tyrosine kinase n=1 Tax=Bifidobacterium ramosum TaxID=1798158 RepID=A0A6L4WZP7_9BIFI|nr:protein-tyrosine kinase [Bifidobacterium ramosum]
MEKSLTIGDLFQILRKHLVSVIISFVVVFAAVAAYTFLAPPKYTATSELFATYSGQSDSASLSTSEISSGASYLSTQIKTYPQLVKTEAVLDPVINELGLDMDSDTLAEVVTATNPSNTFMVDISVEVGDPQQASDIANSVAQNLSKQISSSLYTGDSQKSPIKLTVVKKARVPESPSSPKVPLYLAAGVVLGIIVAVGVALLRDILNTKVDTSDDVRDLTHSSSIGSIPDDESLDDTRPAIVAQPNGVIAEEYRRVRANLDFLRSGEQSGGRLIVITSTDPSEGKTTTSVNTAVALAEDGKSVLLIDADLRHPSVAHKLGLEGHVGLSHILSGQASPLEVVQQYWKPNLHVLPAGKRPASASILLNSDLMRELVEQALTQYDYVIIDTTPLSVSSDATIFGRMAGGLVLVVGKGVVEKKELASMAESLKTAEVPILGFIFNFADAKKMHSSNYYYYEDAPAGKRGGKKSHRRHR